ncbi:YhcH/YjgK/YiaL family protein [Anaerosinus massiliensis]|uniref:YhcH/YjgK/YiaL family protein n=1 Tax=Massilibacillus massiliensis TaxID=1806837 RepID=UPI000DA62FB7|nr:YhcH/YjgK/YiaL family protein [Massilibacillus massiliensis]
MIVGNVNNLDKEICQFPEAIRKALAFLQENDCANLKPGKYVIDAEADIFALVQEYRTKEKKDCRAETHAEYLDIQFLAKGKEVMGQCAYHPSLEIEEDCLKDRDACFYKNLPAESQIILGAGTYAVLYPTDVHRPGCSAEKPEDVVKFVIKINVKSLKTA